MLYERRATPSAPAGAFVPDDDTAIRLSQSERAVMDVDLGAVSHNLSVVRKLCPGSKVLAILKGDAYGAGAGLVAAALQRSGVDAFGVDNVAEGISLRTGGVRRKILVLDGCVPAELAVRYDLTPGISNVQLLRTYDDAATKAGRELPIWLQYNCGFNRSGHRSHEEFREFVRTVRGFEALQVTTIYSHLPATHLDAARSEKQTCEYETALAIARDELGITLESSLLASHGILGQNTMLSGDWVRPGIILYGSACFEASALTDVVADRISLLQPALTLRARLLHKLRFRSAQHCGLGQKYARIGTLSSLSEWTTRR
jgi:alanine racemase